jgi:hypothetical protein
MPLSLAQGSFTKTGTSQSINIGFRPKALILFGKNSLSQGAGSFEKHYGTTVSLNDGTTSIVYGANAADDGASSFTQTYYAGKAWWTTDPTTGSTDDTGTVAFTSTGFTMTWSSTNRTPLIQYIAFGGEDITNTLVKKYKINRLVSGNQNYVGFDFKPDFMITMTNDEEVFDAVNTVADAQTTLGCASSATQQWVTTNFSEDNVSTMDTWRYQRTDRCIASTDFTGAIDFQASFVGWLPDGFTLNWITPPTVDATEIAVLLIKGGSWEAGNFLQPSATGNSDINFTNTMLDPEFLFLASGNNVVSTTIDPHNRMSIGGTTATTQGCTWAGDTDGSANAQNASIDLTTKCIRLATENATHTSSVINAEAQLATNGLETLGKATLNWTTADATARQILYFALGYDTNKVPDRPIKSLPTKGKQFRGRRRIFLDTQSPMFG